MATYMAKAGEVDRKWYVIDASGKVLGRLATEVAVLLRGKHKPIFTPHVDVGDYVVVVNADKIRVTGQKQTKKIYYRHTGYPGGLKKVSFRDLIERKPQKAVELAVKGMLPHNRLGRAMFKKLKVYGGPGHPHEAQQPEVWTAQ